MTLSGGGPTKAAVEGAGTAASVSVPFVVPGAKAKRGAPPGVPSTVASERGAPCPATQETSL